MLLGARQVGKTTLVEPFAKHTKSLFLNCDVVTDRNRLMTASAQSVETAMNTLGDPELLIIDEAQNLPEVGRIVKGWYDSNVATKIVLLGSSSLDLLDATAEPLTGRNRKIFLTPLLFEELLRNQDWYSKELTNDLLKEYWAVQINGLVLGHMVYGGYPEVVTSTNKEECLAELTSDYLLRDVLYNGLVKSPDLIKRLLALLAYQAGSKVNVSELANALNVTRPTVQDYLQLLERSYVIFTVGSYSTNLRNEISKDRKIFFWDTGVRNALLKEFSMSPLRSDIGSLFENWVMAEIAKKNLLQGDRFNIFFWRKTDGGEVDIVIKGTDTFKAYEVKWSKTSKTRGGRAFTNAYDIPVETITQDNVIDVLLAESL